MREQRQQKWPEQTSIGEVTHGNVECKGAIGRNEGATPKGCGHEGWGARNLAHARQSRLQARSCETWIRRETGVRPKTKARRTPVGLHAGHTSSDCNQHEVESDSEVATKA
ncbi:hypothetical protein AXF42_Ash021735 [Apostasia shenzhenica]|uniref:Uncharacterized protein n=1 Tax=Apostasia shenzhenica TaxID=1088818 RepID=A0A2H9ZXZ3_9ASPA|nr:hypothetical protein AXF42_Ash021735 [Apostasia shenzhenica]